PSRLHDRRRRPRPRWGVAPGVGGQAGRPGWAARRQPFEIEARACHDRAKVAVAVVRVVSTGSPLRAASTSRVGQEVVMAETIRAHSSDGTLSSAISDAMVRVLSRYTG